MKSLKLLYIYIIIGAFFSSCVVVNEDDTTISLEQVVSDYDLWYIDYHQKIGNGDIPFVSRAFTLSFLNGVMYANNNIVDVGVSGNGLGIDVGTYNTSSGLLQTNHDIDGRNDFEVTIISENEIEIYNYNQNVTYLLVGYQRNQFDYDKLFYENIEYFLQEYIAWEKVETSTSGVTNGFDNETFLQFIIENITTFYSSIDENGTDIENIKWDFKGSYEVFDIVGYEDIKDLVLNYNNGDIEEFELSVINDGEISLYHYNSKSTYIFSGRGFVQYLKSSTKNTSVRNKGRKRTKIIRKTKVKRNLK